MRQGQQNKQRARRSNNNGGGNRKNTNSASRSYDSNGPDVKIRGTAAHIAEKYNTLARDALSSGDIVMAENYFQHAEHYSRIVATLQAQQLERRAAQVAERGEEATNQPVGSNGADLSDVPQPSFAGSADADDAAEKPAAKTSDAAGDEDGAAEKTVKRRPRRTMRRPRPVEVKPAGADASADSDAGKKADKAVAADSADEDSGLPAFLLS